MGRSVLCVINEDRIAPGKGFGEHGHRDSLGNGEIIHPGEVQRMSAGSGIRHSEFNPSKNEATHLLQIWIEPGESGIAPGCEQHILAPGHNAWRLITSPEAPQGSALIHQDAWLYAAQLELGAALDHTLDPVRLAYVHLVRNHLALNGVEISSGDGVKISDESWLHFGATQESEALLFDLPP